MPVWLVPLIPFLLKEVPEVIDAIGRWKSGGVAVPPEAQLADLVAQVQARREARHRLDGTPVAAPAPPPAFVAAVLSAVAPPPAPGATTVYYPPRH